MAVRLVPDALVRAAGTLLGRAVYALDRAHRRIAAAQPRRRVSDAAGARANAIARAAFAHFGRLLFELLKFSTLSAEAMLARVEFDGEDRARLAYAQGKGVLFVTGHFGFWELHAMVHALRLQPIGVLARAARQPAAQRAARADPAAHRQHGDLPPGNDPPRDADAAGAGTASPCSSISTSRPRRDLRRLLRSARRDDVGGRRAGAPDRRAGRARVSRCRSAPAATA